MKKKEDREKTAAAQVEPEASSPEETPNEAVNAPDSTAVEELEAARAELAERRETFLRLAAEYDNYRKRTAKERETIWTDACAQTAAAFLPVYDNLERAARQETEDAAYAKGVQMTLDQLKDTFTKLGIEEIPALHESFDPALHNAVMHVEREDLGAGMITEVYQAGFRSGEKIIRHSVVVVAN